MNLILLNEHDDEVLLPERDPRARHIRSVLRSADGDVVRIGVPRGRIGCATLTWHGRACRLQCRWGPMANTSLPITVMVGHPRPPVLRRVLKDLSTMRVRRIVVAGTELGERSYQESSVWQSAERALSDGLSQGCHTALPDLEKTATLGEALAFLESHPDLEASPRFCADLTPGAVSLASALALVQDHGQLFAGQPGCMVAIGPERGFSEHELRVFKDRGFTSVGLGGSILRTETAVSLLAGSLAATLSDLRADHPADYLCTHESGN